MPAYLIRTIGSLLLALLTASAHSTTYYNLTQLNPDGTPMTILSSATTPPEINGASAMINGAIFSSAPGDISMQTQNGNIVGTGVLDPFVRIQQTGNGNCNNPPCIESGFNTDGTKRFETKDKGGTNWDHSIRLSDVGTEMINGVKYRDFILDINEANTIDGRMLSLDKFKLYLGSQGNLDQYTESPPDCDYPNGAVCSPNPNDTFTGAKLIYDIDFDVANANADTDSSLGLNYDLNSGSGNGIDMIAKIPDSYFQNAGMGDNPFVYLYSSFGATGTIKSGMSSSNDCKNLDCSNASVGALPDGEYAQSAGFEEWSTRRGMPEPLTLALMGLGLFALVVTSRGRRTHATPA